MLNWDAPVFKGSGQDFCDVRFHRENDLKEWRRGARLPLAFRSIDPLLWASYQAFWAPDKAPAEFDEEERQYHGGYDRRELWALLCETVIDSEDYELRVLWPLDPPDAQWRPISNDRLEVLSNYATINIEKSEIEFPNVGVVSVRLFLRDAVSARAPMKIDPPAQVGGSPGQYRGLWRQKVDQACKELRRREIAITVAAVYDELVASGERPNRETVRRYVAENMRNFEPS